MKVQDLLASRVVSSDFGKLAEKGNALSVMFLHVFFLEIVNSGSIKLIVKI